MITRVINAPDYTQIDGVLNLSSPKGMGMRGFFHLVYAYNSTVDWMRLPGWTPEKVPSSTTAILPYLSGTDVGLQIQRLRRSNALSQEL